MTYVADATSKWSEFAEPGEAQFRLVAVDPAAEVPRPVMVVAGAWDGGGGWVRRTLFVQF